jgi:hypothetical protein
MPLPLMQNGIISEFTSHFISWLFVRHAAEK